MTDETSDDERDEQTITLELDVPIDDRHYEDFEWIDGELDEESAEEVLSRSIVDEQFSLQVENIIHEARQNLKLGKRQEEKQREQIQRAAMEAGVVEANEDD